MARKAEWIVTKAILDEYEEVLSRVRFIKKFPRFQILASQLIDDIQFVATWAFPVETVDLLKDKTDNKFLEAALAAKADFLITGNSLDFRIQEFRNTQIVSPQLYWDKFGIKN